MKFEVNETTPGVAAVRIKRHHMEVATRASASEDCWQKAIRGLYQHLKNANKQNSDRVVVCEGDVRGAVCARAISGPMKRPSQHASKTNRELKVSIVVTAK